MRAVERLGARCEACGHDDARVLQIDHRRPVGREGRPPNSKYVYREVLALATPSAKFALLCANCHVLKTRMNGEYSHHENILQIDLWDFEV